MRARHLAGCLEAFAGAANGATAAQPPERRGESASADEDLEQERILARRVLAALRQMLPPLAKAQPAATVQLATVQLATTDSDRCTVEVATPVSLAAPAPWSQASHIM